MNQRTLGAILTGLFVASSLVAGHAPGPPPAPPQDRHRNSPTDESGKGEGIFGPKEMYPVMDGMQLMPLERLHDLSKLKYEDGSIKWRWDWEEVKEGNFLLPAETMARSTEVIKLAR
ncbi:MAG: hypothetical protein AB7F75_11340, partial [Planctomycetota bacterium]